MYIYIYIYTYIYIHIYIYIYTYDEARQRSSWDAPVSLRRRAFSSCRACEGLIQIVVLIIAIVTRFYHSSIVISNSYYE